MEGKERLEWVFKAVEYLNQYRNKDIQFILADDTKLEAIRSGEMLFEAPAPNEQLQSRTTKQFCNKRWLELKQRKTFEDFIEYELKFIDSIPIEVYNDFEYQFDLIKKYYKDWLKKEKNYFPEGDPFANWRKTKQLFAGFYSNYKLHSKDAQKVNGFAKELYKKEFFNIAHRAGVELEKKVIFLNGEGNTTREGIRTEILTIKNQLTEITTSDLFKGSNMQSMTPNLRNLNQLYILEETFVHLYGQISKPTTKPKQKITHPLKARFCELVQLANLIPRYEHSQTEYCKEVCTKYGLDYSDNVRQYFSWNSKVAKYDPKTKDVIKLILPQIKETDRIKIETYLKNETDIFG